MPKEIGEKIGKKLLSLNGQQVIEIKEILSTKDEKTTWSEVQQYCANKYNVSIYTIQNVRYGKYDNLIDKYKNN